MSGKIVRTATAVAAGLLLTACASTSIPPPTNAVGDAEQALNQAQQAQASQLAAFEFTKAQRKLNQARKLARSDSETERLNARRLAEQAAVDARLAEARARLADTQNRYEQMQDTVESLRQETGLSNGNSGETR
ncbi:DUF4398 domain-containing protein [Thiohalomonas denitrificans]|uniref:DUF4398 domain-containing protein n=1 Tax=Thiohalomonas denitrificans TaxID=415747 RepID=A0A1G5Q8G4_9GAMM|nr:DUF4398 domain-containing protein [Thiohalomonas denitrificans]SCZ57967.1 protein of unknown function [Thiohalomonas denitrificans]